ncbi:MAG: secondary thiamine-phosphate synthase enzyme YjbQ [Melioribacteraceae bacterium]|nr:secondary thiamine-phosphate synthase enzyme YjbQ [Melioribacteraceae bacterium]MCF8266311.1 secondary thiamine-phosphate synthase enzyme YjbQ [Melioribacteraceae bacterium]MCF8414304.1 secondary thiamine-phosphate synthase enzyme YjbQ [Melioribacteraceae bacterium]MCF8432298.1 secondary thiamine-phosphate synthase enzyme YjbQ [Melioribacteraceae bacterium]
MKIFTSDFTLSTNGNTDIIDITADVFKILRQSQTREGNILVFGPGATVGITTIEFEPGLQKDYPAFFEKLAPANVQYFHNDTWHDENGHSHIRAALQGASLTVPFKHGEMILGTWQQIIFIDFDNRPRQRKVIVQVIGE